MELYSTLSSVFTVLSFLLFVGIVLWAWSSRRHAAFAEAANAPFALPDEVAEARERARDALAVAREGALDEAAR
ncbi:MAG TPA: CcoQ/FixQ family Cbb3-type cytochrome c oxidase assembly chaperone [Casimicrobiaceae bacterium]